MAPKTTIGTITLFDPKEKVGVISSLKSPKIKADAPAIPDDLFFQMDDNDLKRLRLGQLVQVVTSKEGEQWKVRDIQVLSMKA